MTSPVSEDFAPERNFKLFTPSGNRPMFPLGVAQRVIPSLVPAPRQPAALRPRQLAPLPLSRTRRTYLRAAIEAEEPMGPVEIILDLWQQGTLHTPGRNLRASIDDYIEALGLKAVAFAMSRAINTHKHGDLAHFFRAICERRIKELP